MFALRISGLIRSSLGSMIIARINDHGSDYVYKLAKKIGRMCRILNERSICVPRIAEVLINSVRLTYSSVGLS